MFRNVMLPLDGSALADAAFPLAVDVAKRCDAHLHLVRVHQVPTPTMDAVVNPQYDAMLREWQREAMFKRLDQARSRGVDGCAVLLEGAVVDELQAYAGSADVDLIIMSTHGRGGIARVVMGSVAEHMVRTSAAPVLLLPSAVDRNRAASASSIKRVLLPMDGTAEGEQILPHAIAIAELCDAELLLLHVAFSPLPLALSAVGPVPVANDYAAGAESSYLDGILRSIPATVRVRAVVGSGMRPGDAILEQAVREQVDLIAMATHGRSGWARVAYGSIAEHVLRHANIPVLMKRVETVRPPDFTELHDRKSLMPDVSGKSRHGEHVG